MASIINKRTRLCVQFVVCYYNNYSVVSLLKVNFWFVTFYGANSVHPTLETLQEFMKGILRTNLKCTFPSNLSSWCTRLIF